MSLDSQVVLVMAGKRNVVAGKVVLKVYLLDNASKTLLVDERTSAEDVLDQMVRKLGFEDSKKAKRYFALYESDGIKVGKQIAPTELVLTAQEKCSKIVFQVKLFMHSLFASTDRGVIRLTYIQAVHAVVSGAILVSRKRRAS